MGVSINPDMSTLLMIRMLIILFHKVLAGRWLPWKINQIRLTQSCGALTRWEFLTLLESVFGG